MARDVLAQNVMHFARLLREAGVPVGPDRVQAALHALGAIDLGERDDVFWALHATLIGRREHQEVFEHAFRIFFRERGGLDDTLALLSPQHHRAVNVRKQRLGVVPCPVPSLPK